MTWHVHFDPPRPSSSARKWSARLNSFTPAASNTLQHPILAIMFLSLSLCLLVLRGEEGQERTQHDRTGQNRTSHKRMKKMPAFRLGLFFFWPAAPQCYGLVSQHSTPYKSGWSSLLHVCVSKQRRNPGMMKLVILKMKMTVWPPEASISSPMYIHMWTNTYCVWVSMCVSAMHACMLYVCMYAHVNSRCLAATPIVPVYVLYVCFFFLLLHGARFHANSSRRPNKQNRYVV